MKFFIAVIALAMSASALAQAHCVKHNMVLFGTQEVFASHIVYKSPHNYQVILKVDFSESIRELYLNTRSQNPGKLVILLLDPTDISKISVGMRLSGTLLVENKEGERTEIAKNVELSPKDYQVLYFDEVPLDLQASHI